MNHQAKAKDIGPMRLELIPLPSANVDESKTFYVDRVGFDVDHDITSGSRQRVVQLTPPGSACSVAIGVGLIDPETAPVRGLHLVVDDLELVHRTLTANGVEVSDPVDVGAGFRYANFSDPDGNIWALQQVPH